MKSLFAATTAVVGVHYNPWVLIMHAGPMVKFTIFILIAASVICWAIIVAKYLMFREANKNTALFLDHFYEGKSWDDLDKQMAWYKGAPLAHVFSAGYNEL